MFCLRGYVFAFLILYSRQQPFKSFKNIYFPVRAAWKYKFVLDDTQPETNQTKNCTNFTEKLRRNLKPLLQNWRFFSVSNVLGNVKTCF